MSLQGVAPGVYVRRHRAFDLNTGLVIGADRCLVIDTHSSLPSARSLIAEIRVTTSLPWVVVNTHAHFDHCFGNAAFRPAPIWGHVRCADDLRETGEEQRTAMAEFAAAAGEPAMRDALIDPPDHTFTDQTSIDLGGREVVLAHHGRGHTDHDVTVTIPDAGVLFAGDLLEEGAPPSFEDSYPLDWPVTLERIDWPDIVVPGHGAVVDPEFVRRQQADLAALARVCRGERTDSPYPDEPTRIAVQRCSEVTSVNSSNPNRPSSRPRPDSL